MKKGWQPATLVSLEIQEHVLPFWKPQIKFCLEPDCQAGSKILKVLQVMLKSWGLLNKLLYHTVQNCQETIKSKHLNHFYICCTVLWSKLRNGRKKFLQLCPFLQIAFEKMKLFKMHQIIKPTGPCRQLFIKITFAFMSVFDFLVKIAIFGAFLFRWRDSLHALLPETNARSRQ